MRPLLKWAGGKRQLLPIFRRFYPPAFNRYFEPFAGSAAVFFDLWTAGRLQRDGVHLSDTSVDLIECYTAVRDRPAAVVAALRRLASGHSTGGSAHYYFVRERFNRRRAARPRADATACRPVLAAMLIYLNRTGYNGLFRLSASGEYNVPAGRYTHPAICDPVHVHAVSAALQSVSLRVGPFDDMTADAAAGDFLYFDPPYAPLSPTSAFAAYTARKFSAADQGRLADLAVALARKGCAVMLSNSSAGTIDALYRRAASAAGAGLALWRLPARRAINSRGSARGPIDELLLTNLEPRPEEAAPGGQRPVARICS